MSRKERPPRKHAADFDVSYSAEAFVEDLREIAALSSALASGTASSELVRQWENYRREFGPESSPSEFAGLMYMRSKYGDSGFRRFVRFDVVTDTLAAYRSEMVRLGLISPEEADGDGVRARVPIDLIQRLLEAPILETPGGMTLGKEAVSRILREVAGARGE